MTDKRVAGVYAAAFVPVAGVAIAASAWVMDLSDRGVPGLPSDAGGWLLKLLPSLAVGFLAYLALGHWLVTATPGRDPRRAHLLRSVALYVVVLVLGAVFLHDGGSPDFWPLGQLVLWPWVTALAGILADGLTTMRKDRGGGGAALT